MCSCFCALGIKCGKKYHIWYLTIYFSPFSLPSWNGISLEVYKVLSPLILLFCDRVTSLATHTPVTEQCKGTIGGRLNIFKHFDCQRPVHILTWYLQSCSTMQSCNLGLCIKKLDWCTIFGNIKYFWLWKQ